MYYLSGIDKQERKTFFFHLTYSLVEGIISGILVLNEFVFLKSLHGSPYQVGMLFQFSMVVLLVAIFINEILRRVANQRKMLRLTAIFTRIPLLALLFFPRQIAEMGADTVYHYIFLLIFLIFYLASPVIFPSINLLLKHNYSTVNFGRLYSYATSAKKITTLAATFGFGLMLDNDPFVFRIIYPAAGVLGIFSIFMLSSIPFDHGHSKRKISLDTGIFRDALKRVSDILRTNKPYRHFQIGFMLYGIAFMGTNAVITIFYDRAVGLNYTSVAFYKNSYNLIAIFLLPVFGRMLANTDPRKFASLTYGSLALYLLSFPATLIYPVYVEFYGVRVYYFLLAGVLFNSIFISTMAISWSIGSAYFCDKSESGDYQSIHLTLTGVRALFVPLAGVYIYNTAGFSLTFIMAVLFLLAGISLMIWSERNYSIKNNL
jgi:hypothetical protein